MANDILLKIEGLRASVEDKEILKGVDLTIRKGEIHAVMGPCFCFVSSVIPTAFHSCSTLNTSSRDLHGK